MKSKIKAGKKFLFKTDFKFKNDEKPIEGYVFFVVITLQYVII